MLNGRHVATVLARRSDTAEALHGGRYCVMDDSEVPSDCLIGGPPCQPYSALRRRGGNVQAMPEEHPFFDSIFGGPGVQGGSYLQVLRSRRPLGGRFGSLARCARPTESTMLEFPCSLLEWLLRYLPV
jgi:hypothetical protein